MPFVLVIVSAGWPSPRTSKAPEPRLEGDERQDRAVAPGEELAIEDAVPRQVPRRRDDLWELCGDVVQVARVEADLVPEPMQLAADAVVLVLDPDSRPEAGKDLGRVLGGRGEHELERMEQGQLGALEATRLRQLGGAADVAGEHARPLHGIERSVERLGQRRLDEPFAEPDAELTGEHADDAPGGLRAREQAGEQLGLACRARRRLDGRERRGDLDEAGRGRFVRGVPGLRQHVADRRADVGEAVIGRGEVRSVSAADPADGIRDGRPTDARRSLIGLGEGSPRQEDDGDRELVGIERSQVVGEEPGLLRGSGRGRDALGELAPAPHAGDGIPCPRG